MSDLPRKRGRPRLLDREAGLEIASRLFWRHGYEGTSIADLTQAMGIAPPSLYATFGSKEELYGLAIDHASKHSNGKRLKALQGEMSAYEAIAFYLHDIADDFTDPGKPRGCMVSNAALQHAEQNESVARSLAERREATTGIIRRRFERAVDEGELPAGTDTEALARFYAAIVQGMSAQACDGACSATLHRLADFALAAWPGLRLAPDGKTRAATGRSAGAYGNRDGVADTESS